MYRTFCSIVALIFAFAKAISLGVLHNYFDVSIKTSGSISWNLIKNGQIKICFEFITIPVEIIRILYFVHFESQIFFSVII